MNNAQRDVKRLMHDVLNQLIHVTENAYLHKDFTTANEYQSAATATALAITSLWPDLRRDFDKFLQSQSSEAMHDYVLGWLHRNLIDDAVTELNIAK